MVMPFAGFYRREVDARGGSSSPSATGRRPDDEARTVLTVRLHAADGGTEQEFRRPGGHQQHFEALKAGTEMFFTRLGEFLSRA